MRLSEFITESRLVDAHTIFKAVQGAHREPNDFVEGDIGDRIYWFDNYQLTNLPISKINLNQYNVDDDLVDSYIDRIKDSPKTMPPIVYDPIEDSIIDGIHRVNAYARLGYNTIPAYVGKTKSQSYGERDEIDEGLKDVAAAGLLSLGLLGSPTKAAQSVLPFDIKQQQAQQQQLAQLKKQAIKKPFVARPFTEIEKVLISTAKQSGIKGVELAQFLAQMAHESWDFKKMREVPQGKNYFKKYDPKHAPKTAKILGNVKPGDGEKYKGRGFIQLTGRNNYKAASDYLNIDLINKPELAAKPDVAAKIALWYWNTRVKPNVDNWADTKQVTRKINPALKGLDDRHENFKEYLALLQK